MAQQRPYVLETEYLPSYETRPKASSREQRHV